MDRIDDELLRLCRLMEVALLMFGQHLPGCDGPVRCSCGWHGTLLSLRKEFSVEQEARSV
jgi:hypothetical protein